MKSASVVSVRFREKRLPYDVGDIAGVSPDKARTLVGIGTARYADFGFALRERLKEAWFWLASPIEAFRNSRPPKLYVSDSDDIDDCEVIIYWSALAGKIDRVSRWVEDNWPIIARDVIVKTVVAAVLATVGILGGLVAKWFGAW